MTRYFINYEDLLENNIINKELNLLSPELFISKKYNNEYKFIPLLYFSDMASDLFNFIIPLNYDEKGIIKVELTKDEASKFDSILIKTYELTNNGTYKKVYDDLKEISLINYNCLLSLNYHEMNLGTIVSVMRCKSDPSKFYLSADRSSLKNNLTLEDRRNLLKKQEIGCDIYFHTENEVLLDRFKDEVTTLKSVDANKYSLSKHNVFIIDSIPQDRVIDFTTQTRRCFFELCNFDSTPVSIVRDDEKYYLNIHEIDSTEKKGYIINNNNFRNILCDSAIVPLINYINVYSLENDVYKKIPLSEYIDKYSLIKLNINKNTSY